MQLCCRKGALRMQDLDLIQKILIWSIPVIFAITLHEVAHGWVANKLGDPTAKKLGRLTINPIKHIDIIGTIVVPVMLLLIPHVNFIFGWAKPVPVAYQNLRNPRRDMAIVAAAGPISNFVMAVFWACVIKLSLTLNTNSFGIFAADNTIARLAVYMGAAGISINLVLMVLNFLPIPPLDGSRVVTSLLPRKAAYYYNKFGNFGFILLVVLLATGILSLILAPAIMFLFQFLVEVFDLYAIQRII